MASKKTVLTPYKLHCNRPPLSAAYGPPDFYILQPGCPEDSLDEKTLKEGYKETAVALGISEDAESLLTHTSQTANPKLLDGDGIAGLRLELLRSLRDVFSYQLEKKKETLQYDVPLAGSLLAPLDSIVPTLADCSQEAAHFWLLDLAGNRPLRFMAQSVPALLSRQPVLRVLLFYQVPVPRAIWCLKMLMANQHSKGTPVPSAAEQTTPFTRMILEQLEQQLLDPYSGVTSNATTPLPPLSPMFDTLGSPLSSDAMEATRTESETLAAAASLNGASWSDNSSVRLHYLTRLMVGCAAEGLLDMGELVIWSATLLGSNTVPQEVLEVVHKLLQSCMEAICTSPLNTRTLAERLTEVAVQQVSKDDPAAMQQTTCLTLLQLVVSNPSSLLPLDCLPQLCEVLPQQAALLGSRVASMASEYVGWLKAQSSALAMSVTPPRTLGLSASVAMQRLSRALAAADPKAGGAVLQEYMAGGGRAHSSPIQEGVSLVCEWAVGDILRSMDPSMLLQPAACHSRPQTQDKILTADPGASQLFALQLLKDLVLSNPVKGQKPAWMMQESVFSWLDARLGSGVEPLDSTSVESDTQNVVSLLLLLVEVGFFSPEAYLTQLLSLGILTQTAGKPPCNSESELQRAQRHRRYLLCMHPQLLQQPGPYSMAPSTPELAEEPLPMTAAARSRKQGWSKSVQDYARDRKSALSIVPPSHPARTAGSNPGASMPEEDSAFPPPKRQRVAEAAGPPPGSSKDAAKAGQLEAVNAAVLATLGYAVPSYAVPTYAAGVESGELPANILDFAGLKSQFNDVGELSQLALLNQIAGLRAWQRRRLGANLRALIEQRMRGMGCKDFTLCSWLEGLGKDVAFSHSSCSSSSPSSLLSSTPTNLTSCLPSGDMWLLRAVGLLVACGYSSAAVELLVHLLELYMQDRVCTALAKQVCTRKEPGAGPGQEPKPAWSGLKVHEGTVVAALDSLQDRVAAMGMLPCLLDTTTSWVFKYNVPPLKGRQCFGRLIQYAASLLGAYWDSPVCKDWWSKFQKRGQPQAANSQHWLVGDLEGLANQAISHSPGSKPSAAAPYAGPLVMPLVGLLPRSGPQRWLQKLSSTLKPQVEAAAANNRTCLQIINRTASCDNADGIMELTCHVANTLATWSGCGKDGHVNEDLVAASIAGLLRNYVKLGPAMAAGNEDNPFHPTPASISQEAHIRCMVELKGILLEHHFSEAEVLVPHALLAGAAIVLKELGFNTKNGMVEVPVVGNTISILLGAVAHGLVGLVDVLNYLLAPGQVPEPVQLLCRAGLLGNTCCRPHGWTCPGSLTHLDLGASCVVEYLQQRLAVDTVWVCCEDLFRRAIFGLAKDPEVQAMRNILCHIPPRRALLSDPRVLYQRLCSSTLTSLPLDRIQQSLTLPARLMAVCILIGDVVQLRHCRPLLESEFDVQQMALLSSAAPHSLDLHWLMLRLMMDEQVLSQSIRVDRKVPKLALETAQAAFAETNKDREKDRSECSQVDKNFCEVMLISLLQRTHSAVLWAELAWQLGKAIGDYLLMRFYVILQDRTRDLLSGTKSVAQKLLDMAEARKKQTDLMRTSSDQDPSTQARSDWTGPVDLGMLQFSASSAEPFAVEQALADLALVGLTKSNIQLRTKIASELVRQLGMVAEMLKGLPATSMEQLMLLLSQQSESTRLEEAGELTPSDALSGGAAAAASDGVVLATQGSGEGPATVRRRSFGPSNARLQRRASAGTKGGDAQPVYPHVGLVQVGIWLKLRILLPLLPMVYADKEPDSKKNMRAILAYSLMQLAFSPYVHAPLHMLRPALPAAQQPALQAAVRAADLAGEPLLDRLLSVLQAVVSGHWAAWLRGNRSKLREVPVHEGCAALAGEVQSQAHLPQLLRTKLLSCLPLKLCTPEMHTPAAAPARVAQEDRSLVGATAAGKGASTRASRTVDPWLPLEMNSNTHGTALGGCIPHTAVRPLPSQQATPLLAGAIRKRRCKLKYSTG